MRKLILTAATLAIGVGIGVGVVFGSDSSNTAIRAASPTPTPGLAFHAASGNHAAVATTAASGKPTFRYVESNNFNLPAMETGGGTGKCPRGYRAINGYFGDQTGTAVPIEDFLGGPAGPNPRKWTVFILNEDPSTTTSAFIGIVCGRM
jgi:hypothetical protein